MKFDLFSKSIPAMPATGEGTKIIDHFRIYNLTTHALDNQCIGLLDNLQSDNFHRASKRPQNSQIVNSQIDWLSK